VSALPIDPLARMVWQPMRDVDLADVAAIEAEVYLFPWTLGNFRDSLAAGYLCTVACIGHELVAYAIVMPAPDEAHLLNIAVARRWQRQGIATRFMRHLIDEARGRKFEMLFLEVRPSNAIGRHLYEQLGFRQLGLRRDYYPAAAGREDALFLGLNLGVAR
jgi:[ribosomal protein S18]-alanine N-acetyltransferase